MKMGDTISNRSPVLLHYQTSAELGVSEEPDLVRSYNRQDEAIYIPDGNQIVESKNNESDDFVLCVRNLCKSYGQGKPVLNNLNMNVRRGTIYGLLGSSGCGKTSLLSCVVGLNKWDSGDIYLFNKRPLDHPGKRVGFMPQDVALYDQITIREAMQYYGTLYGMTSEKIEKQWLWLADFLQLPTEFKIIKDLSGGQKRRASLSLCLLHSPELLILDEPTVGLDPLLRESIWQHLIKMVRTHKTTVIVTTHYIEETRQSDTIGVMRKGRLLVEESPIALLRQYQCQFLEDVVSKLCYSDERLLKENKTNVDKNDISSIENPGNKMDFRKPKQSKNSYDIFEAFQNQWGIPSEKSSQRFNDSLESAPSTVIDRIRAFSTVIWLLFWRHPIFMTMVLFLPTFQIILTLGVVGREPKDLIFGVVDDDSPSFDYCFNDYTPPNSTDVLCNFQSLSCSFINELSEKGVFSLMPLVSREIAEEKMARGDMWGYFYFQSNFSRHMQNLLLEKRFATGESIEGSRFPMVQDRSNYMVTFFTIQDAWRALQTFLRNIAVECGSDPRETEIPLHYRKPVYGKEESNIQDYIMSIIVPMVIFEVPMMMTPILFINDRKQGTLNRARVAGLKFKEVMLSHFITQGSVIIGQTGICFAVTSFLYNFGENGSKTLYFLLSVICGLCGEAFGLLLGVLFANEVEAVVTGSLVGMVLLQLCGTVWPVEIFHSTVKVISYYCTPTSLLGVSIRAVLYKGLGVLDPQVWQGGLMTLVWIVGFWIFSSVIFIKKRR